MKSSSNPALHSFQTAIRASSFLVTRCEGSNTVKSTLKYNGMLATWLHDSHGAALHFIPQCPEPRRVLDPFVSKFPCLLARHKARGEGEGMCSISILLLRQSLTIQSAFGIFIRSSCLTCWFHVLLGVFKVGLCLLLYTTDLRAKLRVSPLK